MERQVELSDAFVAEAHVSLDATSSDAGTVELVVVPGAARLGTPSPGDSNAVTSFVRSNYQLSVSGDPKIYTTKVDGSASPFRGSHRPERRRLCPGRPPFGRSSSARRRA